MYLNSTEKRLLEYKFFENVKMNVDKIKKIFDYIKSIF